MYLQQNLRIMNSTVVFKSQINEELISQIKVEQNFNKFKWWIIGGSYQKHNWKYFFSQMIQCSPMVLYLNDNKNDQIIKEISNVDFKILEILVLTGNNIHNLQALREINCKCLTTLNLSDNKIVRLNCLHKLQNKNINFLVTSKNSIKQQDLNPIKQIKSLSRFYFSNLFIEKLVLQYEVNDSSAQDLSQVVKLSTKTIKNIFINQRRIKQQKLENILKQQYQIIQFNRN